LGYPGSAVLLGLKAGKKLSRGAEEQTGIVLLTLTAHCVQLLNGLEEGPCTEVTGETTTPFITPNRNLLQAVGETNLVYVYDFWSFSQPRVNLLALMALIQQSSGMRGSRTEIVGAAQCNGNHH